MSHPTTREQSYSSWPPHITVAVIVQKEDKFLMVEEKDHNQRVFNQPAGHLEPQETLLDAARREALEETGYHVELTAFTGIYHYLSPHNQITYHRVCFAARAIEQTAKPLDADIIAYHWLSLAEIEAKPLRSPLVTQCIHDYLMGQRAPLEMVQHFI